MRPRYELLDVAGPDRLGEGPWWDAARGELWWVDILGRRVRRATLDGVEAAVIETASEPGFAVPHRGGGLVVGLADGLWTVSEPDDAGARGWSSLWTGPWDPAELRVNDGATDRCGRVWFGTMHRAESEAAGRLYRWDGAAVTERAGGLTVSNGLGWSPDGRTMYHADSPARVVWAYDYDEADGAATGRRVLVADPGPGYPDGLTVDADGGVWVASWSGARLTRHRPDGEVDRVVDMPVAKPTSVAFAGGDLRTLVVTSARTEPGSDGELAGRVFLLDVGAQGMAEARAV